MSRRDSSKGSSTRVLAFPVSELAQSDVPGATGGRLDFDAATVSLEPGVSLVEASAGTGKTFSITQLVLRLLLDRRADGEYRVRGIGNILVVTFTNAATDELITRVRAVLRESTDIFAGSVTEKTAANESLFGLRDLHGSAGLLRLREALASLDQLSIFTIHGFCRRVLEENALESGTPFDATYLKENELIVQRIAQDWWRRTIYEDEQLALLAVHQNWLHDAFLGDLRKWQRLPNTVIDPRVTLAEARQELADAVRRFGAVWDPAHATSFLGARKWYAGAPLREPADQVRAIAAGDALSSGDLRGAIMLIERCTSASMLHEKKGMQKRQDALRDAVPAEPFVMACDDLKPALERLHGALRVACMEEIHRRFEDEKRRRHMLDFDDLLRRLHDALEREKSTAGHLGDAIRARYDAALIDEFQDTDPYQFPIFSRAFAGRPLFLIGDPKQAIFSFRGADLVAYLKAAATASHEYTLGQNWRSTDRMVRAVNSLFERAEPAFLNPRIHFAPSVAARRLADPLEGDGRGALHWWVMPPEEGKEKPLMIGKGDAARRVNHALAREVLDLLTGTAERAAVRPGQIAVLVRTGYEGQAAQAALRAVKVPSIVSGLDDILESRELIELETVLRAVLAPTDARGVRAALATELWGMDAVSIHRLSLPENEPEWERILDDLVGWRDQWNRHGFMRMVQQVLGALRASERLLTHADGERRLTNTRHAVELLHTAASEERLSPEGLLLWITRTRATNEEEAERTELRLESDADAVQIVTIHKSKGLEYDVVFCTGLWSTRITNKDEPVLVHLPDESVVFDHGSAHRDARGKLAAAEELAESLRLVYVALTRARLRCYVAWGAVKVGSTGVHAGHTALGYMLRTPTVATAPEDVAAEVPVAFAASLSSFSAPLEELVGRSAGTMTMETLPDVQLPLAPWMSSAAQHVPTSCRTDLPSWASLQSWRVSSFTSLTAGRHVEDARDVSDSATSKPTEPAPAADPADFLQFAAGLQPGIVLHELFEHVDFGATPAELSVLATEILQRGRLVDDSARIGAVVGMAERVLKAPFPNSTFALRDIPRSQTLREWKFDLPLGSFDSAELASTFARHGGDLARRYAPLLRSLASERTEGFLTGVVDLAFERDGRWHVVDWKSNRLGATAGSYGAEHIEREMFASHYVLQYHLYVTALHRFLRGRVPGYDYDRCIGGAAYAFLRGFDGSGNGWFHDRPPRSLIDALSALMDDPSGSRVGGAGS